MGQPVNMHTRKWKCTFKEGVEPSVEAAQAHTQGGFPRAAFHCSSRTLSLREKGNGWPMAQSQEALCVFLQRLGRPLGPGTLCHLPVLAYQELLPQKARDEIDERGRD